MENKNVKTLYIKSNAKLWKNIFKLHNCMVNEEKVCFDKDNISFRMVDPAHVCMITQDLSKDNLEEYHLDEPLELGLDIDKLLTIFTGSIKNDDMVQFEYDIIKNSLNSQFKMFNRKNGLIDPEGMPYPKIPNLDLPAKVSLNINVLIDFCKQAEKLSDHFRITVDKEGLTLFAEGHTDNINISIPKTLLTTHSSYDTYTSLFSIDYFGNIIKNLKPLHKMVTLEIGNDNPIRITGDDTLKTMVLLAPRIESE